MPNKHFTNPPRKQQGLSLITLLLWGYFIGTLLMLAIRLLPVYSEYFSVVDTLESTASQPGLGSAPNSDIRRMIGRKFTVNDVNTINSRDVKLTKAEGKTKLTAKYEVRTPLYGNMDIVTRFDKSVFLRP